MINAGINITGRVYSPSGTQEQFPEYPGADLTEGVQNYASTIDPGNTNLNARYYFPTGATNLPMLTFVHGYEQEAVDIGEEALRRIARYGYFVVAPEMRGSTGSGGNSGTRDASGREKQDVFDAEESIKANFADNLADGRQGIAGMSGGGIIAWNMLQAYPDRYTAGIIYFGISDYGEWYDEEAARQASLQSYIGGTPVTRPDEYNTRNARLRISNIMCHVSFCHDTEDTSVDVSHSQAMRDLYNAADRTDYYYNESNTESEFRWLHTSLDDTPDLAEFETFWKNRPKQGTINTVPASGTLLIPGRLHTKRFQIWMNDGNMNNAGRSRYGTVVYDSIANTYEVTNDSAGDAVVTVLTESGLVGVAPIAAGDTVVIEPLSIAIDGVTPFVWFEGVSGTLNDGSGNCEIWCDKTGGPQYQGYALRVAASSNLPAILATDLNSLAAIEFDSANSEGIAGERRRDLQGISQFTCIEVSTGTIIDHGQGANNQTQFTVLSAGTTYFYAVSNGSAANGSDAGNNSYLVRTLIYDGSQSTNALRLIRRENKVAQTVSFSGTIPATTESNASSVFGMGKRSYSANYFSGKVAEFIIFPGVLSNVGNIEDILKAKYNI
jgi:dienelactone hydrolase